MLNKQHPIALAIALCFTAANAMAEQPERLFQDEETLRVEIRGPIRTLVRKADKETAPYNAQLSVLGDAGETHAIELSARGNSRRDKNLCTFPPLRVSFTEKPEKQSVFDDQKRLKLVTHCRNASKYQQYYLLEYAAYRLLNVLTPNSLKVRLALIDYVDEDNGKTIATRYGFFIEDVDDAAKRNGLKEIDVADAEIGQIDPQAGGLYAVFQYMIGNLDWSMLHAPPGEDCCHNTRLLAKEQTPPQNMIPVPYDFDYSGLVDTPYAVPPDAVNVRSVRTRRYRGFCVQNSAARAAAVSINAQAAQLYAVFDDIEGLEEKTSRKARIYLAEFFEEIATPEGLERNLIADCRD